MQPYRITTRTVPRVCKQASCSPAVAAPSRSMFTTPFFHPAAASDLGPLFRLIDSAAAELFPSSTNHPTSKGVTGRRSFTPRFDVREVGSNYELQGELPGIQQSDLNIEFVDERTLVIRGKTQRERKESNYDSAVPAEKAVEGGENNTDKAVTPDTASEKSSESGKYHKASVEDEEYVDAGAEANTTTPSDNTVSAPAAAEKAPETKSETQDSGSKYWVSERSVGEFERRFAFPGQVDQDAVTASLKNGILSVVVPKIVERQARRIEVN